MSGVRVDHAAEAREFLVRAAKQGADSLGDDLRVEALVHATLALVEQQRIANLIAFVEAANRSNTNGNPTDADGVARLESAARQVREGLGL